MASRKVNKSAFVRGLSPTLSAGDVVKAAAAKGIKLTDKFVHTIRYNAKKSAAKKAGGGAPARRGPGRPRRASFSGGGTGAGNGLEAAIERIVEAKVNALLKARLGALFGG
jgi:hypothetical protein